MTDPTPPADTPESGHVDEMARVIYGTGWDDCHQVVVAARRGVAQQALIKVLRLASAYLVDKHGVTNRAASDLRRWAAEMEA